MKKVVVSRHPAAIEFIKAEGGLDDDIPVLATATPEDVRGKVVYGNLPLALASLAACVVAVEFAGPPPRGAEYTLADMYEAGARLRRYEVGRPSRRTPVFLDANEQRLLKSLGKLFKSLADAASSVGPMARDYFGLQEGEEWDLFLDFLRGRVEDLPDSLLDEWDRYAEYLKTEIFRPVSVYDSTNNLRIDLGGGRYDDIGGPCPPIQSSHYLVFDGWMER